MASVDEQDLPPCLPRDQAGASNNRRRVAVFLHTQTLDDARVAMDHLKNGAPIILNLDEASAREGRRVLDFATGFCYALDGRPLQLGPKVFLFVPGSVGVDIEDEIPDSGMGSIDARTEI